MEKTNFVRNGVLRLPPGFRFHPTDEELVVQYLRRKVFSCPLPASIIPEFDVCKSDPWDFPGDWGQERYFFSTRQVKYSNGNRSNRVTGSGHWKPTGVDKQVVTSVSGSASKNCQVVGMKKTFVFYRRKPPSDTRTDWIMHEYRLANVETSALVAGNAPPLMAKNVTQDNWVLCRIFLKKRSGKNVDKKNCNRATSAATGTGLVLYDFMGKDRTNLNLAPVSSSSASSAITKANSNGSDDHEEISSYCNSFTTSVKMKH